MRILGIESSCDETSVSVVDIDENNINVLCNVTSSQMGIHKAFGGVVPEVAARNHVTNIYPVLEKALESTAAGDGSDIDLISVTQGPGLMTSLFVGLHVGQTLSYLWQKPVIGVNHLEGHVVSPFIEHEMYPPSSSDFPIVVLTVSGGHTLLVKMDEIGKYEILGSTIDDAAGEAFDKTSKMMGLEYPGGPVIDKLAATGNPKAFDLPRPMLHSKDLNFSFSGLKTAVKYLIRDLGGKENLSEKQRQDIAASFQAAVVEVLTKKTYKAAKAVGAKTIFLAGGVGANSGLREAMKEHVLIDRKYSGDNAAMIAVAGYFQYMSERTNDRENQNNQKEGLKDLPLMANPDLKLRS